MLYWLSLRLFHSFSPYSCLFRWGMTGVAMNVSTNLIMSLSSAIKSSMNETVSTMKTWWGWAIMNNDWRWRCTDEWWSMYCDLIRVRAEPRLCPTKVHGHGYSVHRPWDDELWWLTVIYEYYYFSFFALKQESDIITLLWERLKNN